ncbi:chromosomal replication initiator protein DnaA [Desulfovibrio litoralis]|uniref:Chromosomal replication initiator protein DnaA n=1 Tax=Desulfovibrio litoralis DSM 11393 TaxID=1121455 RepID=A0A1M7RU11_9BACT|nr:chromosomal replication initiator protein DnaA [Desulfovibrio litoralis]SHN49759.1 DnaA family protein [Desulfovibrio litoralis DSM 11393]
MQKRWQEILQVLEHCLDPGLFNIWVSKLEGEINDNILTIKAKNTFVVNAVKERFATIIKEVADNILEQDTVLRFAVLNACDLSLSSSPPNSKDEAGTNSLMPLPVPSSYKLPSQTPKTDYVEVLSSFENCNPQTISPLTQGTQPTKTELSAEKITQLGLPVTYQGLDYKRTSKNNFSWRYSFDSFVVGASNEFAYAASKSLCTNNCFANILFLNSAPGLGKTHLTQASGQLLENSANKQKLNTAYLTAEEFCSQFVATLKNHSTSSFKEKFRELDILLLEDVHFLQGKQKIQDELLASLKAITERGGRVVLSSSFSPKELHDIDDQLISRFSSGIIANIERPNLQTRVKIIQEKSKLHQVVLPEQVTELLASHIQSDIRKIEGCIQNLVLKAKLLNAPVDLNMAMDILKNYINSEVKLSFNEILEKICQGLQLTPEQISSKSRKREYVFARNTAYFLARKYTDLSLQQIGERFNRKHSSVIKGITSLEEEMNRKTQLGMQLKRTISLIEQNSMSYN